MAKQKKSEPQESHNQEIWCLGFLILACFLYVSVHFPQHAGPVGREIVNGLFRSISGKTVEFLPFFVAFYGVAQLVNLARLRRRVILPTLSLGFVATAILLDITVNGADSAWVWPVPITGGGWIGRFGEVVLLNTIGLYGSTILLVGILSISFLLLFNLSLVRSFKWIGLGTWSLLKWAGGRWVKTNFKVKDRLYRLSRLLFFRTVVETERAPVPTKAKRKRIKATPVVVTAVPEPEAELPESAPIPSISAPVIKSDGPRQMPSTESANFEFPPIELLADPTASADFADQQLALNQDQARLLEASLASFNVDAKVVNITPGPSVTRYELRPGAGVKISKITALSQDIALKLAAPSVRIEAPIPGKSLVGIEIPNPSTQMITLRTIIEGTDFYANQAKLLTCVGLTITGDAIVMDLAKMPHVLVAGATGSGKSVLVNALIMSILLRATPDEVKFVMIDPKKVELSLYEGIPHLLAPVVTDPHKAAATLKQWALQEMENRYTEFSKVGVKDITGYNAKIDEIIEAKKTSEEEAKEKLDQFLYPEGQEAEAFFIPKKLPYIVVIIDELADLMMVASQEVENTICRLAQMSRATGIHLVIATQRPSVNVVTGLIKANVPSRISFYLQSQIDSRTILDTAGAEQLLGKGDMLYSPVGSFKPKRLQGAFISEKEVKNVVRFLKKQAKPEYSDEILDVEPIDSKEDKKSRADDVDELFEEAKEIVVSTRYASTSYLQRKLRIGYNRAARIMDQLTEEGVIAEYAGEKKPRQVS